MAKQKENSPIGFLVTEVSEDERRMCALEVRCTTELQKFSAELRELARQACQLALAEPEIMYLTRKQVPWEEVRRHERAVTAQVSSECADYVKIEEKVLSLMGKWYGEVCLMEREMKEGGTFGLRLVKLNKEHSWDVSFAKLVILQIS